MSTIHASALVFADRGVLVRGAAGAGKSSLVLALLAAAPGFARLIGDDRVNVAAVGGRLLASAPDRLGGLIEVRGQGIIPVPALPRAILHLIVERAADARLPEPETAELLGIRLPRIVIPPGDPAAVERTIFAIDRLRR